MKKFLVASPGKTMYCVDVLSETPSLILHESYDTDMLVISQKISGRAIFFSGSDNEFDAYALLCVMRDMERKFPCLSYRIYRKLHKDKNSFPALRLYVKKMCSEMGWKNT